jgi:hypothetical protein
VGHKIKQGTQQDTRHHGDQNAISEAHSGQGPAA